MTVDQADSGWIRHQIPKVVVLGDIAVESPHVVSEGAHLLSHFVAEKDLHALPYRVHAHRAVYKIVRLLASFPVNPLFALPGTEKLFILRIFYRNAAAYSTGVTTPHLHAPDVLQGYNQFPSLKKPLRSALTIEKQFVESGEKGQHILADGPQEIARLH